MGHISSKLLKLVKECEDKTSEPQKDAIETDDQKSSTSHLLGTPVIEEKLKPKTDENIPEESDPVKTKLLRTLKLDPRSPTVGIYRTPILVEDSPFYKISNNCDSPVSVYSCNINDSLVQDVMTPIEPSVNVSDFENTQVLNELDNTLEPEQIIEIERKTKCLRVADRPNSYEARRLLDEILMSDEENFLKKVKMTSKRDKKVEVKMSGEKKINEVKSQLKNRMPLSNITSSTNSPNKTLPNSKIFLQNKVMPDLGFENSVSPKVKHLAQWDQNNTVII